VNQVVVRNTASIIQAIDRISSDMTGPALREGMRAGARGVLELARANLVGHVDTGALWDSLRVTAYYSRAQRKVFAVLKNSGKTFAYSRGGSATWNIAPYYGRFLEFGTIKMQGIHWLERAGQQGGSAVIDDVRTSLARTLASARRASS